MAQPYEVQDGEGGHSASIAAGAARLRALADRANEAADAFCISTAPSPLIESAGLSRALGCTVLLKCDFVLPTGSFKLRGAFEKLRRMTTQERSRGVITASTGNHGLAVATVGRQLGVEVQVHAPAGASTAKLDAIAALGAEIQLHDTDQLSIELITRQRAQDVGATYVSPYNDDDVAAGQGGCAVEMLAQADIDAVCVSVGGGGLLAGVGAVFRTASPQTEIYAAWPANAPSLLHAMRAGHAIDVDETPTLSDATAGAVEEGSVTIDLARAINPIAVQCSEDEIGRALVHLARTERFMVEGAAALALAALVQQRGRLADKRVAVILCGRNIAFDTFRQTLDRYGEAGL